MALDEDHVDRRKHACIGLDQGLCIKNFDSRAGS